jgi:galactokinase
MNNDKDLKPAHKTFFSSETLYEASSPGRMDVMGGIADYSGSLVLQMPIREKTSVKLSKTENGIIRIISRDAGDDSGEFTCQVSDIFQSNTVVDYKIIREKILSRPGGQWAIYVAGCIAVFLKFNKVDFRGADILIESEVPLGKGVSSSAAIEVATLKTLYKAFDLKPEGTQLPVQAQMAENLLVGAPCGLMDQLASYFGEQGKLLPILCQPDKVYPCIDIPEDISFVGIDSGIKHAVRGASYSDVRTAAFMGYTIIAKQLGFDAKDLTIKSGSNNGAKNGNKMPYGGFLANIRPSDFEDLFLKNLPEEIKGKKFIEQYGMIIDHVTNVSSDKTYRVRQCTLHPIYENERVNTFMKLLKNFKRHDNIINRKAKIKKIGEIMYSSHESYSKCGLGNDHTDEIVSMAREMGPENGIYGAKITGGGSGGTVCLLTYKELGMDAAWDLFTEYSDKHGMKDLKFFGG